jgi:hypothetical protein
VVGVTDKFNKAFAAIFIMAAFSTGIQTTLAGNVYRWVDEDGRIHFGDAVPPEAAKGEREIINEHGVTIQTLPREPTDEEIAAWELAASVAESDRLRAEELKRRDSVLLSTYMSVAEIQELRDRRRELLDGRIRVTELYLDNLRNKLAKLQQDASHFQPYSPDPNAAPIHDWLAKELANTLNSILVYEQTLIGTRTQQNNLVAKFEDDISRFRILTGLN